MPMVSGHDLMSDLTEKTGRRLIVISAIVILVKTYRVNLNDLSIFGVSLPAALFDVVAVALVAFGIYSLIVNWLSDLAAFRLWFSDNEIRMQGGIHQNLDASFLRGGIRLLEKLFKLEKGSDWPEDIAVLDPEIKREFSDFKTNVELYIVRLDAAGQRFRTLSRVARFHIWIQAFTIPVLFALVALFLLARQGNFAPPPLVSVSPCASVSTLASS